MCSDGPCMDRYPFVLLLAALGLDLLLLKTLQPFCWSLSSNHLTPLFSLPPIWPETVLSIHMNKSQNPFPLVMTLSYCNAEKECKQTVFLYG